MHPWEERIPGDPLGYHIPPIVLSYWALLLTFTAGTDSDTCAKMRSQHLLAQQIDIDQVAFGQMEGKKKKKIHSATRDLGRALVRGLRELIGSLIFYGKISSRVY